MARREREVRDQTPDRPGHGCSLITLTGWASEESPGLGSSALQSPGSDGGLRSPRGGRRAEKAKHEGAGSGFFSPAGHPNQPAIATFSIEYLMADGRELEIAEIVHDSENRHPTAGGIGLERLTMARNGRMIGWNERLPAFSKRLDQEARRRGVPLPVG